MRAATIAHLLCLSAANLADRLVNLSRLRAVAMLALVPSVVAIGYSLSTPLTSALPAGGLGESAGAPATNHGAAEGRVVAGVQALPTGHQHGAWRIEFGFLPESILPSHDRWSSAVEANRRLLPSSRFATEAVIRSRAQAGNQRWMRSSEIEIAPESGGSIAGRVIVRWNPGPGGSLRLEFGFLPEAALSAAGGNVQAAARNAVLPTSRYLSEETITSRLHRGSTSWLSSSPIDVPVSGGGDDDETLGTGGGTTNGGGTAPPPTPRVTWQPSYPTEGNTVGRTVTPLSAPTAAADGDAVLLRYRYSAVPTAVCAVNPQTGSLQLRTEGDCRVTATSVATANYASASTTVVVQVIPRLQPELEISWEGYPLGAVGETLTPLSEPVATANGQPVRRLEYRYSVDVDSQAVCGVDSRNGDLTLLAEGLCRVTATSEAGGYPSASATVSVQVSSTTTQTPEPRPPHGFARCGDEKVFYFDLSTGMRHHLAISGEQATEIFVESARWRSWWEDIQGWPDSRAACAAWRTDPVGYDLIDARRIAEAGGTGDGTAEPPIVEPTPNPEPRPPSGFAYCGDEKVFYFDLGSGMKHHLAIGGEQATRIFGRPWWQTIQEWPASRDACEAWSSGIAYDLDYARMIARSR